MAYNIIATDEMARLLDHNVKYLISNFKSEQAAVHLLDGLSAIYDKLEINPNIYRLCGDPYLKALDYHEAKIPGMDYMVIYKVAADNVYILGIFHTLENYAGKVKTLCGQFQL